MLGFLRRRHGADRAPLTAPAPLHAPFPPDLAALPDLSAVAVDDLSLLPPPPPPQSPPPGPAVPLPDWVHARHGHGGVDLVFADGTAVRLDPDDPRLRTFLAAAEVLVGR